jgi:hypothetical protein
MGKRIDLRGILRRFTGRESPASGEDADADHLPRKPRTVDVALIIEAARLAVTTRAATKTLFVKQLYVTGDVAEQLLARLEHCEVIAPAQQGKPRRVLATSGELPGVIAEFERRG